MAAGRTLWARRGGPGHGRILVPLIAVFVLSNCEDGCEETSGLEVLRSSFSGTVYVNDEPTGGVTVMGGGSSATTTSNGRYSLSGLVSVTVNASLPGVTFIDNARVLALPVTSDVDFHGYRDATVSGRVLAGGAPVAGATVRLSSLEDARDATSDAQGRFTFTDVPPSGIIGHSLRVASSHPGVTWIALTGTLVVRGRDVTVDLVGSIVGTGIHGHVLWNGVGLPGVTITVTGPENVTRVTDAQGEYVTGFLDDGAYTVTISGYDANAYPFPVTTRDVTLDGNLQVDFIGSTNQPPVATIVSPETGLVRFAGETITFLGEGQDPEDGTLPDGALRWSSSIEGPLGTGWMIAAPLSLGTHTIRLVATDTDGAMDTATVTVQMVEPPAPSGSIAGTVTGNGNAVGDATITLTGPVSMSTTTGAGGGYSFTGLPAGTYTVAVSTPLNITFPAPTQSVTLAHGQAATVNFAGTY
jgi:Carboxypeptidase regulatory-like domain